MAGESGSALDDVIARGDITRYTFFQLVELLNRLEAVDAERGQDFLSAAGAAAL